MASRNETIVLGGGCFWCTEACFALMDGVIATTPGYAGGTTDNPTYEQVCRGKTGHAEVVSVEFDPARVTLDEILEISFASHDPTSLNRQGADVGTQYRSIILYSSQEQKASVNDFIVELQKEYARPIVTQVEALEKFYPAEEYHQNYYARNPGQGYCQVVISPKVKKSRASSAYPEGAGLHRIPSAPDGLWGDR
ncbi:MAG: peptide-methionine (S)-S-oxide reductase MsrA [Candidatus Geothermincolia bacterium]